MGASPLFPAMEREKLSNSVRVRRKIRKKVERSPLKKMETAQFPVSRVLSGEKQTVSPKYEKTFVIYDFPPFLYGGNAL